MPKSGGIARSPDRSIFNFLRKLQIDFQSGCTSLQSYQQSRSVSLFPHPRQHLLSHEFLILAITEDGLVGHHWEERPLGFANFICPSIGETPVPRSGSWCVGECVCVWGGIGDS